MNLRHKIMAALALTGLFVSAPAPVSADGGCSGSQRPVERIWNGSSYSLGGSGWTSGWGAVPITAPYFSGSILQQRVDASGSAGQFKNARYLYIQTITGYSYSWGGNTQIKTHYVNYSASGRVTYVFACFG